MTPESVDDIEVRILVRASFLITLGVYDGPIPNSAVAAHVENLIHAAGGIEPFIDKIKICNVEICNTSFIGGKDG